MSQSSGFCEYRIAADNGTMFTTDDPKQILCLRDQAGPAGTIKAVWVNPDGTDHLLLSETRWPPTPLTVMGQEGFSLVERT